MLKEYKLLIKIMKRIIMHLESKPNTKTAVFHLKKLLISYELQYMRIRRQNEK